jgi:hypothetical protein
VCVCVRSCYTVSYTKYSSDKNWLLALSDYLHGLLLKNVSDAVT